MNRGTALVATLADAVKLAPALDLEELEADGELDLDDLLLSASDAIYDQLVNDGHRPEELTNEASYESAVAWHFLARLVLAGHHPLPAGLDPPRDEQNRPSPYGWSDAYYTRVKPRYATGRTQGRVQEGVPVITNISTRPLFGGRLS